MSLPSTLDCVPFKYLSAETGVPLKPGWDSPACVSSLAHALMLDSDYGDGLPEFSGFLMKIKCKKIERNSSIKDIAIQKKYTALNLAKYLM